MMWWQTAYAAPSASIAALQLLPSRYVYGGPVANCPSRPGMAEGDVVLTACSGQLCWEDNAWTCHKRPDEKPLTPEQQRAASAVKSAEAARRKAAVDAEVQRLGGEYRRAEAERLVTMREQAEAARLRSAPRAIVADGAAVGKALPTNPDDDISRLCPYPGYRTSEWAQAETQAGANAKMLQAVRRACHAGSGPAVAGTIVGPTRCTKPVAMKFETATRYTLARCEVSVACPPYQASCKSARGSGTSSRATQQ